MPGRNGRRDARKKGRKGRRGCGSVFTFLICDRDMLFTHDRSLMLPSLWGEIPKVTWGRGFLDFTVDFWISKWISELQSAFLNNFLNRTRKIQL